MQVYFVGFKPIKKNFENIIKSASFIENPRQKFSLENPGVRLGTFIPPAAVQAGQSCGSVSRIFALEFTLI